MNVKNRLTIEKPDKVTFSLEFQQDISLQSLYLVISDCIAVPADSISLYCGDTKFNDNNIHQLLNTLDQNIRLEISPHIHVKTLVPVGLSLSLVDSESMTIGKLISDTRARDNRPDSKMYPITITSMYLKILNCKPYREYVDIAKLRIDCDQPGMNELTINKIIEKLNSINKSCREPVDRYVIDIQYHDTMYKTIMNFCCDDDL